MHATRRDWLALVALAVMWATAFLATGIAVSDVPPASVAAGRLILGAAVLLVVVRWQGEALPRGRVWWRYAALGFFGNALPFVLIAWGQQRVDSGLASILVAVMPLVTLALAARFVEGERLTPWKVAGFVVGFLGLVLLVGPSALRRLGGEPSDLVRQGAILLAASSYAVNAILARFAPARSLLVNTLGMVGAASMMLLPVAIVVDRPWMLAPHPAALGAIAWLGVVSTAAASVVYLGVIRSAGPTFFSLINYLIPPMALFAGWLVLGEEIAPRVVGSLVVILAGLAISQRDVRRA